MALALGPREVRNESTMMRAINVVTGVRPFDIARIADLGDVRFSNLFSLDVAIKEIEKHFTAIAASGVMPLAVVATSFVTYPILRALAGYRKEPISNNPYQARTTPTHGRNTRARNSTMARPSIGD
ncbi:MAG: arginase family protein [Candidatus Thiodiazotropha sp. (ex. Lucinoma kazani)]